MKKLILLLLFIPLVSFGQTFDYNDLKNINSEKQFKRFAFENEFVKTAEYTNSLTYAQKYEKEEEIASIWSYYYLTSGTFKFQFAKSSNGKSDDSFDRVLEQVKKKCTFYDFKEGGVKFIGAYEREYICYTCPGSSFPGKIGFSRGVENDYIETFTDFN
mgnify:FL=1